MKKDCKNRKPTDVAKPLFKTRGAVRIAGLDLLRGLCVILMMLDHASFDVWEVGDIADNFYSKNNFFTRLYDWVVFDWWDGKTRLAIRLTVICIFFVISGICSSFSHNNAYRGLRLAIASATLSLFTIVADRLFDLGLTILFGVLHCLTVSILICALFQFLLKDKHKYACLGLGILFFIWGLLLDFYNLQDNPLTNLTFRSINFADYIRIMIGTRYYGADCFGLMPFAGIFLIGVYGGCELYKYKKPYLPLFNKTPFKPLCFVGRNAVWFYLLHQPLIFAVVMAIAAALGFTFF